MTRETYIELIIQFMTNNNHSVIDFTEPYVTPSLRYVYPLFMFLHATVGAIGIAGNAAMVIIIGKHRLYQDQTYFLMTNLALADLIKCMIVLPITLANLLIQNWLFGSFLCFFLPMLQCFPVHVTMLTFLTIAIDRYRLIVHPFNSRLPAGLCIIAVWVGAACVVLPYAIYIKYIDLGAMLGDKFMGVGICYVFVEKRIEEYIRAMFVILYAMPLAVIALLYVRISAEMKAKEATAISVHFTQGTTLTDVDNHSHRSNSHITWFSTNQNQPHHSNEIVSKPTMLAEATTSVLSAPKMTCPCRQQQQLSCQRYNRESHGDACSTDSAHRHVSHSHGDACSTDSAHRHVSHSHGDACSTDSTHRHVSHSHGDACSTDSTHRHVSHSHGKPYSERTTHDSDDELDIAKEKRTQNYLITMTTLFAMCWCPLHILLLVNYFVHENEINMSHYDITYIIFTWFGFLSTCITPVLFASWFMTDATKDRLRGYFRFSNRRQFSAGTQRRRYPPKFSQGRHNTQFEEGIVMECRSLEHYNCDFV